MNKVKNQNTPILSQFFDKGRCHHFANEYFPEKHFVSHGSMGRLHLLNQVSLFNDTKELLESLKSPVDALGKNGYRKTFINAIDSWEDYDSGDCMLYITDLSHIPEIDDICSQLASELNVPKRFVTCEGFAAKGKVDVSVHFDHETNFMVQIRGDKTWKVACNSDLINPLFAFFPSNPNRFYDNGLNPYSGEKLPQVMPGEVDEFKVHPGTVTFLPRGHWHQTQTHSESFSIGFVINPPTMTDLVVAYLQKELHKDKEFRAHPLYAKGRDFKGAMIQDLDSLMNYLSTTVANLDSEGIVEAYLKENKTPPRYLFPIS